MEIRQAYRFKARPSSAQAAYFARIAGCCRVLRNAALEQRSTVYSQRRVFIGYRDQAAELKDVKAAFPWIKEAPHHCLQQALRDLEVAFQRFFSGLSSYPTFHRKGQNDSFRFPDRSQITLLSTRGRTGRIKLPKVGELSFVQHRQVLGQLRNVTIFREADGWYVSINTVREVSDPVSPVGEPVGIDLGVVNTITLSGGRGSFSVPTMRVGEERRLRRLQRKLARQQKGSRSRARTKLCIAKLHQRVRRRRTDALHRLTYHLAKSHGTVVVEALRVKSMTKSARGTVASPGRNVRQKSGLNRSILAQGWGELRRQLKYKIAWNGGEYIEVPAAGTSRTCARCGHVAVESRRSQSRFACVRCGSEAHADENAAHNILARGIGSQPVEPLAQVGRAEKPEFQLEGLPLFEASSFRAR